jgi:hypothetical protein
MFSQQEELPMAKKPDEIVPIMLRIREDLRKRLEREAKKRPRPSLNAEIADRLEQSFVYAAQDTRDSAIIEMLINNDKVSSQLLREIADEIAKHPEWASFEGRKDLVGWLHIAAHGKEPIDKKAPIHEPWDNPTTPRKADK